MRDCKKHSEYNKQWLLEHPGYYKKYQEQWRKDNPEYGKRYYKEHLEERKQYKIDHRESISQYFKQRKTIYSEYKKQYDIEHKKDRRIYLKINKEKIKEQHNNWIRKKYKTDLRYNLNSRMSLAIRRSLKGNKAGRYWEALVGYTSIDLIEHLKKTIPKGYIWQDMLKGKLHIDHIIPISAFNFTLPEHIDFKRCWALENLRLLSVKENLTKHNKLSRPFQPALQI